VLQEIVRLQRTDWTAERHGAWLPGVAARVTGDGDARKITHCVRELVKAGLVEKDRDRALATPRGFEVDGILDRISHARGGKFVPMKQSGITDMERYALRSGGYV
jgi:hypothetical protein